MTRSPDQRGHVLLLVTMVLLAMTAAGLRLALRTSAQLDDRPLEEVRLQAQWLARSAVDAGAVGTHDVQTPAGMAQVEVSRQGHALTARVELEGAQAVVAMSPWEERYTPAVTP